MPRSTPASRATSPSVRSPQRAGVLQSATAAARRERLNHGPIDPTKEHPLPTTCSTGHTATQGDANWCVGAPVLANAGYRVYTFNYGNVTGNPNSPIQATADISKSADELDDEIDRVLLETGAEKVILIGHSHGGGILPAYYINNVDGGAEKVSQVIGIAPSNHGTDFNGLVGLLNVPVFGPLVVAVSNIIGPAFIQQTVGFGFPAGGVRRSGHRPTRHLHQHHHAQRRGRHALYAAGPRGATTSPISFCRTGIRATRPGISAWC